MYLQCIIVENLNLTHAFVEKERENMPLSMPKQQAL
jgi:hypothetical protein